jgi:hypothetical protein
MGGLIGLAALASIFTQGEKMVAFAFALSFCLWFCLFCPCLSVFLFTM